LLALLDQLDEKVKSLTAAVQQEAEKRPETQLLMTHPGVGPVTALAFVLIIGYPERFQCGKQIGSYIGLIPQEASSGEHRRLGSHQKARQFSATFPAGVGGTSSSSLRF
jgi:transposase